MIREQIDILLSKESDLVRHYRWSSEKFTEHLPRIHALFGTRFENNTVQLFKDKIIPKLDRSFGIYSRDSISNQDSHSVEMIAINPFDNNQAETFGTELISMKPGQ